MVRRRPAASAFRPSAPVTRSAAPTQRQSVAFLCGVLMIAAAIGVAAFVVKPSKARSFDLVYGSIFINDNASPVAIDLASGKPTVRLRNAFTAVSAKSTGDVDVIGLDGGNTLMLNPSTGEFNMVDSTGFVVKTTGGGVQLPRSTGVSRTSAVPAGDSAYMLQSSADRSSIFLVGVPTVSSAIGTHARAKARAYATINHPLSDLPAPATSANGDLWLLTDTDTPGEHTITELTVPPGSNAGVTLVAQGHGSVSGVAGVATATRNADGSGGDVAAVATSTSVRIYDGTTPTTLPIKVDGSVSEILPATNAQGELAFLYRSTAGWSTVVVPVSGTGQARVTKLTAIAPNARLATPALSDGHLYTMDASGAGELWQVDDPASGSAAHPVVGAQYYPVLAGERGDLTQSEVVARGSRVIFNARANYEAEVVFSDNSHPPRTIDKHSAVQVDPTGATTLADAHSHAAKPGKPTTKPVQTPRPAQAINDKIDCKTTTQTPNIPALHPGDRGSRSIVLTWTYPLLENADCVPSTYVVGVQVLTPGAPSTAAQVTVQGQNGVTLTGLFPATEYELTVAAFINKQHTTSPPVRVTTGPEGPAAPTDVRAIANSTGDWTVSWNSCGGIQQGCVPSTAWNVVPKYCDDRGLSNVPATLSVAADPTVHSFTKIYPGSDALLGRGLCFAVQGVSPQGTNGTLSDFTAPVYSWSPPNAADLKLTASQPANTSLGGSASTSVDLSLGSDPVRTVGGLGATVTFTLNGPGGPKTKTVTFDGQSGELATTFPGIQAGAQYTAMAVVHPPGHPTVSASTPVVTVTTRATWPDLTASASCPAGGGPIVLSCTLSVQIGGLASSAAGGELFTLADNSGVVCGSSGFQLSKSDFDPSSATISQSVDLLQYNGSCTVNLALREGSNARDPAVFGGTTSPTFSTSVNLGQATTLGAGAGDFAAAWNAHDGSSVLVQYVGDMTDNQVGQIADRWSVQLFAPDGTSCGATAAQPTHDGIYLDVDPASCVNVYGSQPGWLVSISYFDKNTPNQHMPWDHKPIPDTPPGYVPCTVDPSQFNAAWEGTSDEPDVAITYGGDLDGLKGCGTTWTYELHFLATGSCSRASGTPSSDGVRIPAQDCSTDPPLPGWNVDVSYTDAAGRDRTITVSVPGSPPAPAPPTTSPPTPSPSGS